MTNPETEKSENKKETNREAMNQTVEQLKTLRDEIKVKAHLLKMDAKDEWNNLEEKWTKFNQSMEPAKKAAGEAAKEVGSAASMLGDELAKGYRKIRDSLKN